MPNVALRSRSCALSRVSSPRIPRIVPMRISTATAAAAASVDPGGRGGLELRICTSGRTCKRQGSKEVQKFGHDLGLEEIDIIGCGCLGACGRGPNAVLLPAELIVYHLATPNDLVELLRDVVGLEVPDTMVQSTQLRVAGNMLAQEGQLQKAVDMYTKAIDLAPPRGLHYLLCNRSAAYLQLGRKEAALEDAIAAQQAAPTTYQNGWVRLIDCQYALQKYSDAAETTRKAAELVPGFKSSKEFLAISQALKQAGTKI